MGEDRESGELSAVILFDGVCNLCNAAVQFVIARDPRGHFKFAALQSETGREVVRRFGLPLDRLDTMVLVEGDRCYSQSEAALRIASRLKGAWPLVGVLRVIPRSLRERLYQLVADHRYQWFGRRSSCMVPTPELAARFLR